MVQWPKLWDPDAGWGDRVGSLVRELDPTRQLRKKKEEEEGEKQESWEDRDKKRGRWGVRETQVPPPGPLGGTNLPALLNKPCFHIEDEVMDSFLRCVLPEPGTLFTSHNTQGGVCVSVCVCVC